MWTYIIGAEHFNRIRSSKERQTPIAQVSHRNPLLAGGTAEDLWRDLQALESSLQVCQSWTGRIGRKMPRVSAPLCRFAYSHTRLIYLRAIGNTEVAINRVSTGRLDAVDKPILSPLLIMNIDFSEIFYRALLALFSRCPVFEQVGRCAQYSIVIVSSILATHWSAEIRRRKTARTYIWDARRIIMYPASPTFIVHFAILI